MAIANDTTGIWVNNDGLRVKIAGAEAVKGKGGEYEYDSSMHVTEFDVDFSTINLGTSQTNVYILDYDTVFADGSVIEKIDIKVGTGFTSGGAATLDIGLVARGTDSTSFTTITDADGLVAALALTTINAAGKISSLTVGTTSAGALLGTALAADNVMSVNFGTAAYTAGTMRLYVYWRPAA
jgi:hypothetical protein